MENYQDDRAYQQEMDAQAEAEHQAQMNAQAQAEAEYESEMAQMQSEIPQCPTPTRELSFGEKLVGLTFNPSGDAKVQKAKELCAELADLLNRDYLDKESSAMHSRLFNHAICEILNAQMNVVKVLTYRD